jgi:RecG-like helicase
MKLTKSLLHTTEAYIQKLNEVSVETVEDFLRLFPRDFEDSSDVITRFISITVTEKQTVQGTIEMLTEERTRNGKILIKAILSDSDNNTIECVWFGRRMLMSQFRK